MVTANRSDTRIALDRDGVRQFVAERIAPRAGEFDRNQRVPADVLGELSSAGLWGAALPDDVGGAGLDMVTFGAVHEEVGRGCSSVRSLLTVHSMVSAAIHRWGTPGQRAEWLPQLARGAAIGAYCLTEPEAGTDTNAIATEAVRCGGRWTLTGRKKWITGGQVADLLLVFARGEFGTAAFLVPSHSRGVTVTPIRGVLGTRGSMLAEIALDQVDVGPDALLGPERFGSAIVMADSLDLGRYSVACGCVGIAQACLELCAEYTSRRRVHGRPLRELDLVRAKLTDMVADSRAARLLCRHAGALKDSGDRAAIMATWVAKYFAARAANDIAAETVQTLGANGCADDSPAQRLYRDAKIMEIIEGSTEIQQLTIAEEAYRDT